MTPKLLAFYLPQFHPIAENDQWWGKGFTDWTNVTRSRPLFPGHWQPHLPADLGFYDLRLGETRAAQAALARAHGIHGFCYYHYWFGGKQLLERPLQEVLATGEPDFPFCLCWANENWTRRWDGRDQEVLMAQTYSAEDDEAHIAWLIKVFKDPRYIRVGGKRPLLVMYRFDGVPQVPERLALWRKRAREAGFDDLYLCAEINHFSAWPDRQILDLGFDAVVEFHPNRRCLEPFIVAAMQSKQPLLNIDYRSYTRLAMQGYGAQRQAIPSVFPCWDNSARRKSPCIIQNEDAMLYRQWLENALAFSAARAQNCGATECFVFLNAWNEWAEGCHLEPDLRHGTAFLRATADALRKFSGFAEPLAVRTAMD